MKLIQWTILLFAMTFIQTSAYATSLPYFDAKDMTPYWENNTSSATHTPAIISKFELLNQNGQKVTLQNFSNHTSIVNFFFTSCGGVCPLMMQNLKNIRPKISDNVHFYSISITPTVDDEAQLLAYAKHMDINLNAWDLLTGPEKMVFDLGRNVFKTDKARAAEQAKGRFIHSDNVYLVDKNLYIRGVYSGMNSGSLKLLLNDQQLLNSLPQLQFVLLR